MSRHKSGLVALPSTDWEGQAVRTILIFASAQAVQQAAMMAALFILFGCVQAPTAWRRVDGVAVVSDKLQADTLACKGEVERAAMAGQSKSTVDSPLGMDRQDNRAFLGCMAGKGYLPQEH
jgi:hypothetical protein